MKRGKIIFAFIVFVLMFVSVFFYVNAGKTSFEVNRVLIKSVIKEGESLNSTLKMTNLGEKKNFEIEILDKKSYISE